ncbi:hypothetical protein EH228_15385 [Erwinia endophytica]|uniref:hypothetical protein n=1 Tax=Erwinia endophytica TaxID=1563158 RepID=UPI0012660553|nr:hypothetical protein [Erwinia endophytica]KAB8307378.1 hypothetical protein EH228_15385 [Erwinia endophytica]
MGQHFITPAAAGKHLRDDYGAATGFTFMSTNPSITPDKQNSRTTRRFPEDQRRKVDAMGRLNHVA